MNIEEIRKEFEREVNEAQASYNEAMEKWLRGGVQKCALLLGARHTILVPTEPGTKARPINPTAIGRWDVCLIDEATNKTLPEWIGRQEQVQSEARPVGRVSGSTHIVWVDPAKVKRVMEK